ncbi:MAG: SRPBCC family protein [Leptolyngbyaceae cyanobacterium]
MPLVTPPEQLTQSLNPTEQRNLKKGKVILTGTEGAYAVFSHVNAPREIVWQVLTSYEQFPDFLPSVVACRILEKRDNRIVVERKDRRKIGWLPIRVKIVTENIETRLERIDYRMVEGTLDEMSGHWQVAAIANQTAEANQTLLVQTIVAKASMGPLQPYFYEVFEAGLTETMAELRAEMERR